MNRDEIQYPAAVKPTTEPQVMYVGPDLAADWLETTEKNRNVRERKVQTYAGDMRDGAWRLTGEAVQFDWNGHLIDGRHRLLAVLESATTQPFVVMCGLDPATQDVIDAGAARTGADMFGLAGETNATLLAATVRIGLTLEANSNARTTADVSHSALSMWLHEHEDIRDAVRAAYRFSRNIPAGPSSLAYAWWLINAVDSEQCEEFFVSMVEHRLRGIGDPRLALIRRLESMKEDRQRLPFIIQIQLIVKAWNAWRKDQSLQHLRVPPAGETVTIPKAI